MWGGCDVWDISMFPGAEVEEFRGATDCTGCVTEMLTHPGISKNGMIHPGQDLDQHNWSNIFLYYFSDF